MWSARAGGASFAESDDREVREACLEAELLFDQVADRVEVLDRHRGEGGAALAVEVLGLPASGEYVEACSVCEVDVTDDAEALEDLEVSVDRGDVDREFARELLRGDWAVGGEQCLEHEPAGVETRIPRLRITWIASSTVARCSGGVCGASVNRRPFWWRSGGRPAACRRSILAAGQASASPADRALASSIPTLHFSSIFAKRQTASASVQVATNITTMMKPAVLMLKF